MITRKIGKLLRGKATPLQLMLACIIGSMLGFIPGFAQGAGLIVVLLVLLAVLNANLFLAGISGLAAKAIALLIAPVTFLVGRVLLDGPLSGLFQAMINMPILALFGFEYYLTTGGIVMGLIVGIIFGLLVIRGITRFRTKMASMQEGSERYKKYADKWYVKLFTFVFIGGGGKKKDYQKFLSKKYGNPIRPIGVVAAALFLMLIGIIGQFFSEPLVTRALTAGLERANGATVDIGSAELSFRDSRLTISGFAMADANDLSRDLLRAERIEAAISGRDLLRKRLALDDVTLIEAGTGETRRVPGRIVGRPPRPAPEDPDLRKPEEKTIQDYLEEAEQWKERLAQVRRWIERISGPEEAVEDDPRKKRETLRDRLDRQIRELGYAWVRANHLIDDTPTFIVYRLDAENMRSAQLEDETVTLRGRNLSTHPHLSDEPASVRIESSRDRFFALLSLDHLVNQAESSVIRFHLKELPSDRIAFAGRAPLQGGTIDISADGTYGEEGAGWINLPLRALIKDATLAAGGREERVDSFDLPIGVRGPIDQPLITIDDEMLVRGLVDAGAARLVGELEGRIDESIGEKLDDIKDKLPGGIGDRLREGGGLFGGDR
ncbi:MAG: hypothetical protein EA377_09135 [Phycisphaerales bacterium]|nr:MAG: hypothetical protein EA377_09135 [Phycisphaerales bacterium]